MGKLKSACGVIDGCAVAVLLLVDGWCTISESLLVRFHLSRLVGTGLLSGILASVGGSPLARAFSSRFRYSLVIFPMMSFITLSLSLFMGLLRRFRWCNLLSSGAASDTSTLLNSDEVGELEKAAEDDEVENGAPVNSESDSIP